MPLGALGVGCIMKIYSELDNGDVESSVIILTKNWSLSKSQMKT